MPQDQRTFEGRPLDRQNEYLEDQGLAFDLGTLVSRRRALGVFGAGASVFALAECSSTPTSTSSPSATASTPAPSASATPSPTATYNEKMPEETAGPYPGDGSNGQGVLEISEVERSDITTSIDGGTTANGVPMMLTMNIVDMVNNNGPLTGAAVYVWHCDAQGNYSMYSAGLENTTYLRGMQVVGDDGTVTFTFTFTTIFPGCYMGRWAHIHFEVFPDIDSITDASNVILTLQVALPEKQCNTVYARSEYSGSAQALASTTLDTDNIFSDGWETQMADVTGNVNGGYTAHIDVPIDTNTEPQAGRGDGSASPLIPPSPLRSSGTRTRRRHPGKSRAASSMSERVSSALHEGDLPAGPAQRGIIATGPFPRICTAWASCRSPPGTGD